MDRALLQTTVRSFDPSPWRCTACGVGRLVTVSLESKDTAESIQVRHDDENWEPDWSEGRFSALLKCDGCGDPAVVAGHTVWEVDYDDRGQFATEAYQPTYISPPVLPISLTSVPETVKNELVKSFSLYWGDPAAAGNRIRCAVERMLDDRKVPKKFKNAKGKMYRPNLDGRIKRFEKKYPRHHREIDRLHAIRWLGNAGSHGALTHEDVVIAYEILDSVLEAVYRPSKLDAHVKAILKKKGPARRR